MSAETFAAAFADICVPGAEPPLVAPESPQQAADCLLMASQLGLPVRLRGAGLHQGIGHPVAARVGVTTAALKRIIEVVPADLVAVVEAGVTVGRLETELQEVGLTAALTTEEPEATVGGVVAAGLSGWTRLRYGPTRDRLLEVTVATGDGRVVRGGGRVVKNVSGYDLPRLLTGSLGALGLITEVALKLWPRVAAAAQVATGDPGSALAATHRPLAVLEVPAAGMVYLGGTPAAVAAEAARVGGESAPLEWPGVPAGRMRLRLRVPPHETAAAVDRIRDGWEFVAAHGVGEIRLGADSMTVPDAESLRAWAVARGGSLIVERAGVLEGLDPWGPAPTSLELQRRVKAAFDPAGVVNPGILPGRI